MNNKLTTTRGKKHKYLGMTIIIDKGEVRNLMHDYSVMLIKNLLCDMVRTKKAPAPEYLFRTDGDSGGDGDGDSDSVLLSTALKEKFHNITAKTLSLSQQSQLGL